MEATPKNVKLDDTLGSVEEYSVTITTEVHSLNINGAE